MRIISILALAGYVALVSSISFAIPAAAESADHRGPVPNKGHLLGGVGGLGNQKSTNADTGPDGSGEHPAGSSGQGAGVGGGGSVPGAGGQSDQTGVAARLADVAGDVFGYSGASNSNSGGGVHGAPGPIAGAGLPFVGIGYGVYWLIRRRRGAP